MSGDDGHLRASDADRDRAVAELRAHHDDGRLSVDDLEERVAAAYAAVTWGQLSGLFTDLPGHAPAPGPGAPAPAPPAAGVATAVAGGGGFTYRTTLAVAPDRALLRAAEHLGPGLSACRYELTGRLPHRLSYTRTRVPAWAWVVAVLLPGPGFLAPVLAPREEVSIHIDVSAHGTGSVLVIHGVAPRQIRRALAGLR